VGYQKIGPLLHQLPPFVEQISAAVDGFARGLNAGHRQTRRIE